MTAVDDELSKKGVSIPTRPLAAIGLFGHKCNLQLPIAARVHDIVAGDFSPPQLSLRIERWMEHRYGDRLNLDFSIGYTVVLLRGAVYSVRCPVVSGAARFICDPSSVGTDRPTLGDDHLPIHDIFDLTQGMTADLARSLDPDEVRDLLEAHAQAMNAYSALDDIPDVRFVKEAHGDLAAAVKHLLEHRPRPGLSKWDSLQACEKLLKAFIATKRQKVKRVHDLEELVNAAEPLGLPRPEPGCLAHVQCSPGVRYGEPTVSLDEALLAFHASLDICRIAAVAICAATGKKPPRRCDPDSG